MSSSPNIKPSYLVLPSIVLAVVLFLAINVIATRTMDGARIDLTENSLYSVTDGTRKLLKDLKEPIHLRLFLSENLVKSAPQLAAYANRVKTMLETYASLSDGTLTLEIIDPQPFSDAEDRAVGLGINRFRLAGAGDPLFFGLAATNSTDGKAEIGVFSPDREAFLEYDLSRLIAELGQPGKPVIAMIDGVGLAGNPRVGMPEQQLSLQLSDFYTVERLTGDVDAMPKGTRIALVIHPQNLSDRTLYTLDQWVLSGGATMIFVDPFAETQPGMQPGMPAPNPTSDLPKLFEAWGVDYDPSKAVGDPANALRAVRVLDGRQVDVANYPWLNIQENGMETSDALLSQLSSIILTTAGGFSSTGDATSLAPLLSPSSEAGFLPAREAANPETDPRRLLSSLEKPEAPIHLAARLTGSLKSAFTDGKPEGSTFSDTHRTEIDGPANVILVGDADMLMDRNWIQIRTMLGQQVVQAFANNGDLVLNAIEQMVGGAALADLRGRGISSRPFERIADLNRKAEAQYLAKEQELLQRLQQTEAKILELSADTGSDDELVTAETEEAIARFRSDLLSTRAQLRDVQFDLRRDVETLKGWITTANVGIIPALLAIIAIGIAVRRPRRKLPEKLPETTTET